MNSDVGGTLRYIITADTDDFERTLRKAGKDFESFADQINQASGGVGKELKDSVTDGSTEGTRAFRKFVNDSIGALGEFTSALAKVSFNSFTTAAGAASTAMSAMVGKGMNIGSSLEKNRLSFEALTGSVKGAETVLTSVADFASENPYQLLDVSNVARELVAMGRSADQVAPDLAKLGAIGVATGADLGSLGHVYGQIAAQGKMMTQDMYQLVNQGVAIMPALSKVTGKSMTELKDYISKGQVTMEVFEQALTQVVDPAMYENLLNKMNNTIPRQMDRLKGSISTFATSLVGIDKWTGQKLETGLAQTYTNILKKLADNLRNPQLIASVQKLGQAIAKMVDKFVPLIDKIAPALTKVFDKLADNTGALLPIVGGALVMFGKLGANLPGIGGIIGNLSGSISGLGKAFKKLLLVNPLLGAFVAMLAIGLPKALSNESFRKSIGSIVNSLGKMGQALAPVIAQIAELAAAIGSAVLIPTINALAKVLEVLANVISAIPTPVLTGIVTALMGFLALKKIQSTLKGTGKAIEAVTKPISKVGNKAGSGIGNLIANIIKPLGDSKVLKGAASAALIGAAIYAIALGLEKVSSTNINVGNLAGMLTATAIIAVIMNVIGKFAKNIAFGALATTLIGVSLYAVAVGLQKVSTVGSSINIAALGVMAAAIAIAAVIVGVIGIFAEFVALGAIATAVLGVGLVAAAWGLAEASKQASEINMGGILLLSGAVALTSVILTALLLFSAFGAVGAIATAVIGVGLAIAATTLKFASEEGSKIDMAGILKLGAVIAETSLILTAILLLSAFGAVGAIASAIIGGGLAIAAAGLKSASENGKSIDMGGIYALMGAVTITSGLLTAILLLSAFGAVSAVATTIIAGGLALTALGLKSASENGAQIDMAGIWNLMEAVTLTSVLMGLIMPLSVFGAISSIATSIIAGGLVLTAKGLKEASEVSAEIKPQNLRKLQEAITYVAELQTGNLWANLVNMVNTGILSKVAENIQDISNTLVNIPVVRTSAVRKIKEAIGEFASISTGDIWTNLSNLINSGMIAKIAENARDITSTFNEMKPVNLNSVKKIKEAIETFSQIKIEGNGLFEDKGGASEMLLRVARNATGIINLFANMRTDGLEEKLNDLERALSRNGKGWPVNWAQSFVDYINKLNEAKANFLGVAVFIRAVNVWNTDSLLEKFNQFEQAISRDGKAWEPWYAERFIEYIKKLTDNSRSFDLVDQFIKKVSDWNTVELLDQFNRFEKAVSRDGKSWEPWYAERFRDYIKKLVEDSRSLDLVDIFINKVVDWNTKDLLTQFNDFEKAVSRDGKSWEPWYAEKFMTYIKKLVEDQNSLDLVDVFIHKVENWDTDNLLDRFNKFENAVSRGGKSWEPWYAEKFSEYIKKLVSDQTSLDMVSVFIDKVKSWSGDDLLSKFNDFEKAVSRDGKGWPMTWVDQFKNYIKKLSEGDGGFNLVTIFIDKVKSWATDDLKTQFDKFENAISRGGAGWPMYWAEQFGNYVKKLSGESNLDSVTNFIDHVMNWKTSELLTKFNEFEDAVSRHGNGWPATWADQFKEYIKKLGEINGSMDTINTFIEKVKSWTEVAEGGKSLSESFNNFEDAVSRHGNGWPINWAESFKNYVQKLSEIGDLNLEGISGFITKVGEWTTVGEGGTDLLTQFNNIENAISRHGAGWPINWAEEFVNWMVKIGEAQDSGAMEALSQIFIKASEINTEGLYDKLHEIERIVSRDGGGYPLDHATAFVDYWNEFSYLTYDFGSLATFIRNVAGLTVDDVFAVVTAVVNSISEFVTAAQAKKPEFLTTGGEFAENLINGWESKNIAQALEKAVNDVITTIGDKARAFYNAGNQLGKQFRQGLYDVDYANSGWWAVQGFINGANNRNWGGAVWQVGRRIANDFLNGLRSAGGEGSPWKETMKSGIFAGEGFAIGLRSQVKEVQNAAEEIAEAIRSPFEDLDNMTIGVSGGTNSGSGMTKYLTVNQNNNINNEMDYRTMMADLKWELFTA